METVNGFCVKAKLDINVDEILNRLFKLEHLWVSRSKDFPFYTLGRSAYLDGNTENYKLDYFIENDILRRNFNDLYEAMLKYVSGELKEEVRLAWDLAHPGFHIFPADEKFLTIAGNWHTDYPHETLGLGNEDTSTITVCLMLPKSGGGVEWIDRNNNVHYQPYQVKQLIWHKGDVVHRISGFKEYVPGEFRITMQGHLVRRNGQMELYW